MSSSGTPGPDPRQRLQYLLKHAEMQLNDLSTVALAPLGIDPRELGILTVLAAGAPMSQLQAAQRLGIDRTTMVAMLDALENKRLVVRRPDPHDRRRNVVELTVDGEATLGSGISATEEVERRFLEPLQARAAQLLRDSLRSVLVRTAPREP